MNSELPENQERELSIRLATMDDAVLLWEWANDSSVRQQSFNPQKISWESHLKWLSARINSSSTRFYLLLENGEPTGQIRYDRDECGESAEISFSIAREHRGKRLGIEIIKLTCARASKDLDCRTITALVIKGNEASYKAFLGAGFETDGFTERQGKKSYKFVWKRSEN